MGSAEAVTHARSVVDELRRSGEFRRIANFYALPVLINQTLDSGWFHTLVFIGTVALLVRQSLGRLSRATWCSNSCSWAG